MRGNTKDQTTPETGNFNSMQIHTQLLVARADDRVRFDSYTTVEKDRAMDRIREAMESHVSSEGGVVIRPYVARLRATSRPAA